VLSFLDEEGLQIMTRDLEALSDLFSGERTKEHHESNENEKQRSNWNV